MSGLEALEGKLRSVASRKQDALFAAGTVLQNAVEAKIAGHVRTGALSESVVAVVGDHLEHVGPYYSWFVKGRFTEDELTAAKLAFVKELLK